MLERKKSKKPLRELAEEIGVSISYLSMILAGEREPGDQVLEYLGLERRTVFVKK